MQLNLLLNPSGLKLSRILEPVNGTNFKGLSQTYFTHYGYEAVKHIALYYNKSGIIMGAWSLSIGMDVRIIGSPRKLAPLLLPTTIVLSIDTMSGV